MALKPLHAQDETGQRWVVYEEDAAWAACRRLALQGVKELVLPRSLLLYGDLTEVKMSARIEQMSVQLVQENPALATLLRRYVRLADCVAYLRGTASASTGRDSNEAEDEDAPMGDR